MIDGFLIKQGITLQGLSGPPSDPLNGDIYYDNTLNAFQLYQNNAWVYVGVGGVLPYSAGGTGLSSTPADGQLLIGNGSGYTLSTLTAGANVTITNGAGSVTVSASGGGGGSSPSGSIVAFGGSVAPSGWLICDGSAVSRTTYSALFAAIATNYGVGDGSTTFNLPDTRGYFLRGWDDGAGNDPNSGSRTASNGGNSGDNVGSYQGQATAVNGLALSSSAATFTISGAPSGAFQGQLVPGFNDPTGNVYVSGTVSSSLTGSLSGNAETRPINLYVAWIIKT